MKKVMMSAAILVIALATWSMASGQDASKATPVSANKAAPTFSKDVAPIVFNHCAACHRPGEIGPMPLLSYNDARPWAKAIRKVVATGKMPPWGADPHYGKFVNDVSLSQKQIDTIVAWVDAGAPEGNRQDLPQLPKFTDGWNIGTPDVVFTAQEFDVPASGIVDYQNFRVPTNFTEDKYVQAAELRIGNRKVVHHAVVFIEPPGGVKKGESANGESAGNHSQEHRLAGYSPGENPLEMRPGVVKFVPKGSTLVFNMHYTPNGTATKDQTSIGVVFAKKPPEKHLGTLIVGTRNIDILPDAPYQEVKATYLVEKDMHIEALRPHMHARGKDAIFRLTYPDGRSEVLLSVPKYDFTWQLDYFLTEPLAVPKGSRIDVTAHYDNSVNNPFNPDHTKEVKFGWQTWDEMLAGYVEYTLDDEDLRGQSAKLETASTK